MTEIQATPPPAPPASTAPGGIFGTKIPSTVVFGIAILLFLLPFVEIRCNSVSIQSVSGAQLATGFKVEAGGSNSLLGGFDNSNFGENRAENKGDSKPPNTYAMVALAAGVLAFLISFANSKKISFAGIALGIVAAIGLIGLWIDVQQKVKGEIVNEKDVSISVDFTSWFYISLIAFLMGAYFSYRRLKSNPT
ncbi:MAG TPA: hypothetical protein VK644_04175 [Chitinophagaceae bacterium]|nr:hypothetical protein [Chitinophagaceae bacterium]